MTEGKVVSFLKTSGDRVEKGEVIFIVESDKADMDVESLHKGFLVSLVQEGETANVGETIGLIADTKAELEKILRDTESKLDTTKVFIVHGHDDLAKLECARFVEKMGFDSIILHEQISSGRTIIEKIEEYSNVGFGIVLYTPCDVGAKNDENTISQPRARQNVVFEHGFLMGKLGRNNVCALVKGKIETPTDISGIVYILMDEYGAWKLKLAKEMQNSGYGIDINKMLRE